MEKSDKVRIMSHFSLSHEPLVILYLPISTDVQLKPQPSSTTPPPNVNERPQQMAQNEKETLRSQPSPPEVLCSLDTNPDIFETAYFLTRIHITLEGSPFQAPR